MDFKIAILFLLLNLYFYLAMSLDCIGCEGSLNSTCQMGTLQKFNQCPADQPACYEEYIHYTGQSALYRRNCGLPDRCVTSAHRTVHGEALKYCRTCKEDKCNNKAMSLDCIRCEGSVNSTCQMGTSQTSYRCPPDQPACYEEHIQYTGKSPLYRRDCGLTDRCVTSGHRTVHGEALKYCRTCKEDNCNNKIIEVIILECMKCIGSIYSSDCQMGEEETTEICPPGKDVCSEHTIFTEKEESYYIRKCSPSNFCDTQKKINGDTLEYCRTCKEKKCNNQYMELAKQLHEDRRFKYYNDLAADAGLVG